MDEQLLVSIIFIIGLILLPLGLAILIYGWLGWTEREYFYTATIVIGTLVMVILGMLLMRR